MAIHYQFDGPEDAPVLVLSNSLGADLTMWDPQAASLSQHFRLLRYDTRGHGRSSAPPDPYTIDQLGGDVIELLDQLGLRVVSFCGLSMGGLTGLWLGLHAPERLRKLILCNTGAKIGTTEMWNTRIEQVRSGGMVSIVEMTLERWLGAEYRAAHRDRTEAVRRMILASPVDGYLANCAALRDADLRERAREVRVPTMIVTGSRDPATPPELGRFLAGEIAGSQYVELESAHLSNIEAAAEFNRAVLDFASRGAEPGEAPAPPQRTIVSEPRP